MYLQKYITVDSYDRKVKTSRDPSITLSSAQIAQNIKSRMKILQLTSLLEKALMCL